MSLPAISGSGRTAEHSPANLAVIAGRAVTRWAPEFRTLIGLADPTTLSQFAIRTSTPVGPWPAGRVTLIGDAIHAMTPYRGIGANVHYKPVHLHSYYRERLGCGPGLCPVAEAAYQRILTLPLYPAMTEQDIRRVVDTIERICRAQGK